MKRRNFFKWLSLGSISSWLTVAIAACTNNNTASTPSITSPATAPAGGSNPGSPAKVGGFLQAGKISDLQKQGRLLVKDGQTSVLVMNNPSKPGSVYAIDSVCTHQGCAVDWDSDKKQIMCPCHGSSFNVDGTVSQGVATKPLKTYEAKVEGDNILIKL